MQAQKYLPVLFLLLTAKFADAQKSTLDVGVRIQQTVNLYNENGIAISYSDKHLRPGKLFFGFSYVTSRLGTALNSNAIKQDNFLVSAAWHLRSHRVIQPFGRLNTGFFMADYNNKIFDELPRKSLSLAPDIGVSFQTRLPLKIATSVGYNLITGDGMSGPGTLYPVFYQLTVSWNLLDHAALAGRKKLKL